MSSQGSNARKYQELYLQGIRQCQLDKVQRALDWLISDGDDGEDKDRNSIQYCYTPSKVPALHVLLCTSISMLKENENSVNPQEDKEVEETENVEKEKDEFERQRFLILKLLILEYDVSPNIPHPITGSTALHSWLEAEGGRKYRQEEKLREFQHIDRPKKKKKKGGKENFNKREEELNDDDERENISLPSSKYFSTILQFLLQHGGNPYLLNTSQGYSSTQVAARTGCHEALDCFLLQGVLFSPDILHLAASHGHAPCVQYILQHVHGKTVHLPPSASEQNEKKEEEEGTLTEKSDEYTYNFTSTTFINVQAYEMALKRYLGTDTYKDVESKNYNDDHGAKRNSKRFITVDERFIDRTPSQYAAMVGQLETLRLLLLWSSPTVTPFLDVHESRFQRNLLHFAAGEGKDENKGVILFLVGENERRFVEFKKQMKALEKEGHQEEGEGWHASEMKATIENDKERPPEQAITEAAPLVVNEEDHSALQLLLNVAQEERKGMESDNSSSFYLPLFENAIPRDPSPQKKEKEEAIKKEEEKEVNNEDYPASPIFPSPHREELEDNHGEGGEKAKRKNYLSRLPIDLLMGRDRGGLTPVDLALSRGNKENAKLLLQFVTSSLKKSFAVPSSVSGGFLDSSTASRASLSPPKTTSPNLLLLSGKQAQAEQMISYLNSVHSTSTSAVMEGEEKHQTSSIITNPSDVRGDAGSYLSQLKEYYQISSSSIHGAGTTQSHCDPKIPASYIQKQDPSASTKFASTFEKHERLVMEQQRRGKNTLSEREAEERGQHRVPFKEQFADLQKKLDRVSSSTTAQGSASFSGGENVHHVDYFQNLSTAGNASDESMMSASELWKAHRRGVMMAAPTSTTFQQK